MQMEMLRKDILIFISRSRVKKQYSISDFRLAMGYAIGSSGVYEIVYVYII